MQQVGLPFSPMGIFQGSWIPDVIERNPELTPAAKLIYARLVRFAGKDGRAFPKQTTLAENLGLSLSGVKKGLKQLIKNGFIKSIPGNPLTHQPNSYIFLYHSSFPDSHKVAIHGEAQKEPPLEENQLRESEEKNPPCKYLGTLVDVEPDNGMVEVVTPPGLHIEEDGRVFKNGIHIGNVSKSHTECIGPMTPSPPANLTSRVIGLIEKKANRRFSVDGKWLQQMRNEINKLRLQVDNDSDRIIRVLEWWVESECPISIENRFDLNDKFSRIENAMRFNGIKNDTVPDDADRLSATGVDRHIGSLPPKDLSHDPAPRGGNVPSFNLDFYLSERAKGRFSGMTESEVQEELEKPEFYGLKESAND